MLKAVGNTPLHQSSSSAGYPFSWWKCGSWTKLLRDQGQNLKRCPISSLKVMWICFSFYGFAESKVAISAPFSLTGAVPWGQRLTWTGLSVTVPPRRRASRYPCPSSRMLLPPSSLSSRQWRERVLGLIVSLKSWQGQQFLWVRTNVSSRCKSCRVKRLLGPQCWVGGSTRRNWSCHCEQAVWWLVLQGSLWAARKARAGLQPSQWGRCTSPVGLVIKEFTWAIKNI